ncbi:hypothetical protein DERF_011315 [Dermatophagoides farinae]|uniref:G-protein coupled receptors family 1 profile domain-containing protein n=1 Tax=Dermatophagoides farinae TaxID=6954 RepID=A0A922L4N6_DERFA|nr:uncharacterized protein LOC124494964 [Dermatophagoides farinae]KAH7636894.1 hypothetical protein HUG17_7100 [Dermatophagoides farinae]KAH9506589.1 hypothetical protein DERF_011315 [Dermatophagoides farinae]
MTEVSIFSTGDNPMNILTDIDHHHRHNHTHQDTHHFHQNHQQDYYHPNNHYNENHHHHHSTIHPNFNNPELAIHIDDYQFYAIVIQVILGITTNATILCSLAIKIRRRRRQNQHVINHGFGKQQSQIPVIDIIITLFFIESLLKILFRSTIQLGCFYGYCIIYNEILCYLQGFGITFMHYIHLWTMALFIHDRYIKHYKQQSDYLCKCTHMVLYLTMSCIVFLITLHLCAPIYGFSNYRFLYDELTCAIDWSTRHSCPFYVYSLLLITGPASIPLIYWMMRITYNSYRNNNIRINWRMFCQHYRCCCFRSQNKNNVDGSIGDNGDETKNSISNDNDKDNYSQTSSYHHHVPTIRFSKHSEQIEISSHRQQQPHVQQQQQQQQQQQNLESVITIAEYNKITFSPSTTKDDNDNFIIPLSMMPISKSQSKPPTSSPSIESINQYSMPISVKKSCDHHKHCVSSSTIGETMKSETTKADIIVTSSTSASITSIASNSKVAIDMDDNDSNGSENKKCSQIHRKPIKTILKLKRSSLLLKHRTTTTDRRSSPFGSGCKTRCSGNGNGGNLSCSTSSGLDNRRTATRTKTTVATSSTQFSQQHRQQSRSIVFNETRELISITICSWIYISGYLLKLFIDGCHACLPTLFQTMTTSSLSSSSSPESSSKFLVYQFFIVYINEMASTVLLPLIMLFTHPNLRVILYGCLELLWSSLIRLSIRCSRCITSSSSTMRTGTHTPMDTFNLSNATIIDDKASHRHHHHHHH